MNIDHLRYFLVLSQEMHYSRAAQRLGVGRTTLYRKMKKYGIAPRRGLESGAEP